MKQTVIMILLSWFFLAHSWSGLPGGGTPSSERNILYGPFKDKATCEDIRRQVAAISPCWEA